MISLILPTQGNPVALLRTLESTSRIVDDIVIGSVCPFKTDRDIIALYKNDFNITLIDLPFDFIFKNGFSHTLNTLAENAKNDVVLYLNVGEVIEKGENILDKITDEYNSWYIDHAIEKHRWWRCYNRHEMKWDGLIHEEIVGEFRPYHKPILTFADTEKDMNDSFKAKVYNDIKECVYWRQLMRLVDEPDVVGSTNGGWIQFAESQYESMKERLEQKGDRYKAFLLGDFEMYMNDVMSNPEFEKERFESHIGIEFQGSPMFLGKTPEVNNKSWIP